MGWFEVINTALNVASTASSVSVASNINKMQKTNEGNQQAYMELSQLIDLADIIKRKIKIIRKQLEHSPNSVLVLSNFYEKALRSLVASPSSIPIIEVRPLFRDLYEDLEELTDEATSSLTQEEIIRADECLEAILDMPDIELAIRERENQDELSTQAIAAESYLKSIDEEWKEISGPANRAKTKMVLGIVSLTIALLLSCTVMPLVVSLPILGVNMLSQNFLSGMASIIIGLLLIVLFLALIVGGVYLIIKGKNPNPDRFRELNTRRNESMDILKMMNHPTNIPAKYHHMSLQELYGLYEHKNKIINSILGDFGDPKKMLLAEEF